MKTSTGAISLIERVLFLRQVPLFADLKPTDLERVAEIAEERGYAHGETIAAVAEIARTRGARRLIVGTAETSTGAIAFYRRVGLLDDGIRHGFFDTYPEPVVEDGRVAHDMLMFTMDL